MLITPLPVLRERLTDPDIAALVETFDAERYNDNATLAENLLFGTPVGGTFDIDFVDPAFAPGTGTPEVGGLTTIEALNLVRGLRGLNLVGADIVEVAPPYDPSGNTALVGATMMYELLCLLAEAAGARKSNRTAR